MLMTNEVLALIVVGVVAWRYINSKGAEDE
jgi:hypothetical protein